MVNISLEEMLGVNAEYYDSINHKEEEILPAGSRKFVELRPQANAKRKKPDIFNIEYLDLSYTLDTRQKELKYMLIKFQSMPDGRLGEINITKHCI